MNLGKNRTQMLVLALIMIAVSSCSSSSNVEQVCSNTATRILELCDLTNQADFESVNQYFDLFDLTLSEEDLSTTTSNRLEDICLARQGEFTIEDSELQAYNAALETVSNCNELITFVRAAFNDLTGG